MALPNKVKQATRDYRGGQAVHENRHALRVGDPEMTKLWAEYTHPENHSTQWSYRKRVIRTAQRLLTGRPNWFLEQDRNPLVVEYNYQFILDTLRYIATGRRRIDIHTWPDLVMNYPEEGLEDISGRCEIAKVFQDRLLGLKVNDLITRWCRHPRGFDDMVCSLNILFGDLHVKLQDTP